MRRIARFVGVFYTQFTADLPQQLEQKQVEQGLKPVLQRWRYAVTVERIYTFTARWTQRSSNLLIYQILSNWLESCDGQVAHAEKKNDAAREVTMRDLETKFGNLDYQQQLAVALASTQGLEAAIRSCQEFGWDGVLDHLLNTRDPEQHQTPAPRHK